MLPAKTAASDAFCSTVPGAPPGCLSPFIERIIENQSLSISTVQSLYFLSPLYNSPHIAVVATRSLAFYSLRRSTGHLHLVLLVVLLVSLR